MIDLYITPKCLRLFPFPSLRLFTPRYEPTMASNLNAEFADNASSDAVIPSGSANNAVLRLLDLPPELVARITSFVNDEVLIMLRLACKTLEAITFERFVTEHFETVYCWILDNTDFRRLHDILQHSPRLSSRIRQIVLTADVLKGRPLSTVHCVCDYDEHVGRSRIWSKSSLYFGKECPANLKTITVSRILRDLQRLPQPISVVVDLVVHGHTGILFSGIRSCCAPEHTMLFSLATLRMKVHNLKVDEYAFEDSDDLLAHDRVNIVACMSTLRVFEFVGNIPHDQMPIYEEILRCAPQLRSLALNTSIDMESEIHLKGLDSELLVAKNISALATLRITRASMVEHCLIEALQHCRTTLTHLTMLHVALSTSDEGWVRVAQTLLAMPKLVFVELQIIAAGSQTSTNFFVPHENGCQESHTYEGRERVVEGLQGLLKPHWPCKGE